MDINSIRTTNLRSVVASQSRTQSAAAEKLRTTKPYFSSLMNGKPITSKFARRVEDAYSLARGWMDQDHSGPSITKLVRLSADDVLVGRNGECRPGCDEITFLKVGPRAFAFVAIDTSMSGEVEKGETVVVDPAREPVSGCLVMIRSKTGVLIRKYYVNEEGESIFLPTNIHFPKVVSNPSTHIDVVGVVIEVFGPRRTVHDFGLAKEPALSA